MTRTRESSAAKVPYEVSEGCVMSSQLTDFAPVRRVIPRNPFLSDSKRSSPKLR